MTTRNLAQTEQWYQNPWVWLIICVPSLTVLGCLVTVYLALSNPDYLVKDPQESAQTAQRGQS